MELWLIFVLASIGFGTISLIFKKKALTNEHTSEYLTSFKLLELLLILLFAPFIVFKIPFVLVAFIFLISFTTSIALFFINRTYRHNDLSVVAPLSNLSPLFIVLLAFFVLGEHITAKHAFGIGLLLAGTYYLESEHHAGHWLEPIKKFFKTKNLGFWFLGIFLSSVVGIGEKFMVGIISPFTLIFYHYCFQTFFFLVFTMFFYGGFKDVVHAFRNSWKCLLGNAFFANLANLAYLIAISMTFISLAAPVKKLSTLFAVLLSGRLFNERRILHKSLACVIMLAGVFIIAI